MTRSSNSFARKQFPRDTTNTAWKGDNLTSDYYDEAFISGQIGGLPYGSDVSEYGGIRHFRNLDGTS